MAHLVQKIGSVERVPLFGDEARVADDAAQFLFGGAIVGAGGGDDVLFDHDAAHIVAAEAQPELAGLEALRDPGGLHVLDVIEVDARDRQRLQVLDSGSFLFDEAAERSVFALVGPGDEGGEAAGFLLQVADQFQVVHALLDGFAAAEHHGGGGAHAELVGGAVNVDPILHPALQAADALAHGVVQNFSAAAGDGVEAGIHQALNRVAQAEAADLGDVDDLRGGEAVQVDTEALLDAAEQVFVPLDLEVGMQPALHENAGAAEVDGLLNLLVDSLVGEDVAFGVAHGPVESAEAAELGTEIGVVDVAIDDVGNDSLGVPLAAHRIGSHADADQVVGSKQSQRLFTRNHRNPQPVLSR